MALSPDITQNHCSEIRDQHTSELPRGIDSRTICFSRMGRLYDALGPLQRLLYEAKKVARITWVV